jgi:biotin carboxyl carrier protein
VKLEVEIGGRRRKIEIARAGERLNCWIDGRLIEADVAETSPGNYSFLVDGRSLDVRVDGRGQNLRISSGRREFDATVRDPRKYRKGNGSVLAEGRQQVTAPMPGKVVRVLVKAGEAVAAGQGIVVVEAMKMQNEVKAPKAGKIEKLLVADGQSVNAGDALAVVS